MGALGLDYRGERLRWSLDAIYQEYDTDSFRGQMGFLDADIPKAPKGDTNLFPGAKLTQRDQTIMSRLEYDFTDHITAHIGAGYRDGKNRQLLPWTAGADANGDFTIYNYYYDSYSKTFSGDTGLTATFRTGPVGHRVAFGVTRMAQENGNSFTTGGMGNSNIYDPAPLPALPAERLRPAKTDDTTLTSYALADTLSFMQDRVLLTLGARHQTVNVDSVSSEDYRSSAVSPVVGLVVKPLRNVSVYANFTKGLTSGGTVPLGYGYENEGDTLKPYKSKSAEAGVKVDWGSLTTTAALFQIERPSAYANDDNLYGYFGEQRNRGLELNAFGEIVPSLRVMASATFINSELTKTQDGVNQGNRAQGVPSRAFSLGLDWDVPGVQGLAVNGRAIYTSAVYLDNAHEKRLPGVTRFDLGARYRTEVAGKEVVLRANVENVADKRYWLAAGQNGSNGYASYAAGRTYMLSASVNF
jgi:iron complex outermembrane receptor protein